MMLPKAAVFAHAQAEVAAALGSPLGPALSRFS